MQEIEVPSVVPGRMTVLVVNMSGNIHGNEQPLATNLLKQLRWNGVHLASPDVITANNLAELTMACQCDFNCILLVSHANAPDPFLAQEVTLGSERITWSLLTRTGLPLEDKMLALCICHAHNEESIGEMYFGEAMVLILVGPKATLNGPEAMDFYRNYLIALSRVSRESIDPFQAHQLLDKHNHRANYKMRCQP